MVAFRTDGAWGRGTGYNLTAKDIDQNFYGLWARVDSLAAHPPRPVDVVDIQFSVEQVSLHMSDGSVEGPFSMPEVSYAWRGDWAGSSAYDVFDVFYADGYGLYLVVGDYTSGFSFNPNAAGIQIVVGLLGDEIYARPVFNSDAVDDYLTIAQAGWYVRYLGESPIVRLSPDSTGLWHEGVNFILRQTQAGLLTLAPDSGVTLTVPEGRQAFANRVGAVVYLRWAALNTWEAWGDLAPVASTSEASSEAMSEPSSEVTSEPTSEPTSEATSEPTSEATSEPTSEPTSEATSEPTSEEPTSEEPTSEATSEPTSEPTSEATSEPTSEATSEPTSEATSEPTSEATSEPTSEATSEAGPSFLGVAEDSGSGPFAFSAFDLGTPYEGRRILYVVSASGAGGGPSFTFSIGTEEQTADVYQDAGRTKVGFFLVDDDSLSSVDLGVTVSASAERVFVAAYSLPGGEIVDYDGLADNENLHEHSFATVPGTTIIGFAIGRATSGGGGVGVAHTHATADSSEETYSVRRHPYNAPDALTWTGLDEDHESSALSSANYMTTLFVRVDPSSEPPSEATSEPTSEATSEPPSELPATSYANPGGSGNRTAMITGTSSPAPGVNTMSLLLNGNTSIGIVWWSTGSAANRYFQFDFGTPRYIDEVHWYWDNSTALGTWQWQRSDDGTNWTNIGDPFALSGALAYHDLSANTGKGRYYRLLGISGTFSSTPNCTEVEFKIDDGT